MSQADKQEAEHQELEGTSSLNSVTPALVHPTVVPVKGHFKTPSVGASLSPMPDSSKLYTNIASTDFLSFKLTRSYQDQLQAAVSKTGKLCAIDASIKTISGMDVVWIEHEYGFIGGSLGCAEGKKIALCIEKAIELNLPVVLLVRSGGARMQEGTSALMQMASVSFAVLELKKHSLPYITVCCDPTFGGTTASYVLQGDFKIAYTNARIGFAGEQVILNTVYKMDQAAYDAACPQGFQTAGFVKEHGQIDATVESDGELHELLGRVLRILSKAKKARIADSGPQTSVQPAGYVPDFNRARRSDRVQVQDVVKAVFTDYVELSGDGRIGRDCCIRGGLALLGGCPVMVVGTFKGHDPVSLKEANFGMPSPHGYRTAGRLMRLAEHFGIPVVTLVDTPGAYPSFSSEVEGQPEAISSNLLLMAGLKIPIVTVLVGEGGSGGAIGLAVADRLAMLSDGYYSVITPEGAASILCRYRTEEEKARKFVEDCKRIASIQRIYAPDLKELGVIDEIIWEQPGARYDACPDVMENIRKFLTHALYELSTPSGAALIEARHRKFGAMGSASTLSDDEVIRSLSTGLSVAPMRPSAKSAADAQPMTEAERAFKVKLGQMLKFVANTIVNGDHSVMTTPLPPELGVIKRLAPLHPELLAADTTENAKTVLDRAGPQAAAAWVRRQQRVLVTDTSMRDAHQSLLATRVRTTDLLSVADEAAVVLRRAFSFECWGGATFDVCIRFLHESPWERLRLLRKHCPNVCLQMLLRGANAVGYKSYPDNVIVSFIELAAKNGIDVFRIFDCFNDVEQMRLCIDTVRRVGKIAEATICFTGNFLSAAETIYTLEYYKDVARRLQAAGAHIIAVKDMAGLFKPSMAAPFMRAMREATDLPIHFHTHNTSHAALLSCAEMAKAGCDIIDLATASMADTTSQPSLNAFLTSLEGAPYCPDIDWLTLERLDLQWAAIRALYFPNESGLKCGTARVYDHQIPGGQYTNLIAQCKSLGIWNRWSDVLDMYRDVNTLLGNIIKVTPSSKVVGDFALFLINKGLTVQDVLERGDAIDFPDSVVDLYRGMIGFPHHGLNPAIAKAVLKNRQPLHGRPGATLPPADFAGERARLTDVLGRAPTDEEVITSFLYPQQYADFVKFKREFGDDLVSALPTFVFFYGMKIGSTVPFVYRGKEYTLHLHRVYPLSQDNMRTLVFHVDGSVYETKVKESKTGTGAASGQIANPSDPAQIPSPLPGIVDKVYVKVDDVVQKGALLVSVAAMKMEVQVKAPHDGKVTQLCVREGAKVDNKTLLLKLEMAK